jgi:hypothetical protein
MHDDWYSVYVETRAPAGVATAPDEDAADGLMALLEDYSGVVSAGETSWSATVSVPASGAAEAAARGANFIDQMAEKAGMPPWPQVRAEAVLQDLVDAENARPTLPELASVPEAADMLGVSPQRVRELAVGGRGFPQPVYELSTGKLWLRDAIVAFGERRRRKPGRPGKGILMAERVASLLQANAMPEIDIAYVVDGATLVVQIKTHGLPAARRRLAVKFINVLHGDRLGVMARNDDFADEIEAYLADGHPGEVFELPEEMAGQALRH